MDHNFETAVTIVFKKTFIKECREATLCKDEEQILTTEQFISIKRYIENHLKKLNLGDIIKVYEKTNPRIPLNHNTLELGERIHYSIIKNAEKFLKLI